MRDFIPSNDAEFLIWLKNFRNKLSMYIYHFGISPEDLGKLDMLISSMETSVQEVAAQKEVMAKTVTQKDGVRKELEAMIRAEANRTKTNKNYTEAIGQELGIVGSKSRFDPATYKASGKATVAGSMVRIKFSKKGVDGVNVYVRRKGEVEWKFRTRDNNSPYEERIVLENPAVPEHWEYRLVGVIKDVEVGLPSDVIEVIIGA
ncbi:MAG: hypothetical protein ACK4TA_20390 [Saprospiraceae bacterium]